MPTDDVKFAPKSVDIKIEVIGNLNFIAPKIDIDFLHNPDEFGVEPFNVISLGDVNCFQVLKGLVQLLHRVDRTATIRC